MKLPDNVRQQLPTLEEGGKETLTSRVATLVMQLWLWPCGKHLVSLTRSTTCDPDVNVFVLSIRCRLDGLPYHVVVKAWRQRSRFFKKHSVKCGFHNERIEMALRWLNTEQQS